MPLNESPEAERIKGIDLSPNFTPTERIQKFLDTDFGNEHYHGFDKDMIRNDLKLISVSREETVFEMEVKEKHAGTAGILHVGAAALMFDICTSTAIIPHAKPGFWQNIAVTRNLNLTYIRPAPIGTTLIITSKVVHAGKKLATIQGVAAYKKDGKIVSIADHLKFDFTPGAEKL